MKRVRSLIIGNGSHEDIRVAFAEEAGTIRITMMGSPLLRWIGRVVCLLVVAAAPLAMAGESPWVVEHAEYAPGRFGEGMRFDWWRSKVFFKAPGYLLPQSGTIQMWVMPLTDVKDIQDYATLLHAAPTAPSHKFSVMGITILPDNDARTVGKNALNFYVTGEKSPFYAMMENLTWKKNEWHAVAVSWGARGACLYMDGELVAQNRSPGVALTEVPDLISFGGGLLSRYVYSAHSVLDEIEISDCERPVEYIREFAKRQVPPVPDAHTTALHHCDRTEAPATWQMTDALRGQKPYAVSGSAFLTSYRVFAAGTQAELPLTLVNPGVGEATFSVTAEVQDFRGAKQPPVQTTFKVAGGAVSEITLKPEVKTPGWYSYRLAVKVADKEVYNRPYSFVIAPVVDGGFASAENYFGHHLASTRKSDVFTMAGIPWERDMDSISWATVEPEKGKFDWRAADYLASQAKKNSQRLVWVLGGTPRWAGKAVEDRAKWVNQPATYRSTAYPPADLKDFYNYVFQTVSRYKGTVKYWEIWNEPDWNRPELQGLGFMGTDADYLEVLKTGYTAAKAADPDCVVLSGGFVPHAHLIDYLVKHDGTRYFDILGMHRYRSWEDYMRYAKLVGKPYWQTEKQLFKAEEVGSEIQLAMQNRVGKYFLFDASKSCFNEFDWSPTPFYFAGALAAQKLGVRQWSRTISFPGYGNLISGTLLDAGRPSQVAALTPFYQGSNDLNVTFNAPAGKTVTVTDYMGAVTQLKAEAGKPLRVSVRSMTYIEGEFDAATFRMDSFSERALLRNTDFTELDGDVGIDKLAEMKPRGWRLWTEGGTISPTKDEEGNALVFAARAKGLLRVTQHAELGKVGFYRVSAEFKRVGEEEATAYISVYDVDSVKNLVSQTWSNLESGRYKRYSVVVALGEKNRNVSVIFGMAGGKGSFMMRRPEMVPTVNPELAAKTTYIDLKPYANQTLDDEVAGDGKGGWADLGSGNASFLKTGERDYGDVLFRIIDGDVKTTKAAIILGDAKHAALPRQVEKIKVGGKFKELAFLHTAMFVTAEKGRELGRYVVTYADGSQETIPIVRAKNIDDWYAPGVDPSMKVLEEIVAPSQLRFAFFGLKWANPHAEKSIDSIDFVSDGNGLLALLAISGINP